MHTSGPSFFSHFCKGFRYEVISLIYAKSTVFFPGMEMEVSRLGLSHGFKSRTEFTVDLVNFIETNTIGHFNLKTYSVSSSTFGYFW